ncbi:hypothetical protein HZH66_012218 [Vespula vulgaris]|uniref:Uncharacterized protein n=1 Tax=Vespula vulgaris TaxID=7454 RepID=A0A834JBY9_VESVU|nr:hypothetical protein HZH66_012218 [Vespula vulgaris]
MSLNNFNIVHTSKESEFTDNRNTEKSSSRNFLTSKLSDKIDNTVLLNFNTTSKNNKNEHLRRVTSSSDNEAQNGMILNDDLNDRFEDHLRKETIDEKQETQLFSQKNYTLTLIDVTICTITIGPSVVGFWRGVWGLMDFHQEMFPFWLCFTFGILFHMMFAVMKYQLHNYVNNKIKKNSLFNQILCQIFKIIYTFVFGIMCIIHWRYSWIILDEYLHIHKLWINASLTTTFISVLAGLRCIRNLLAPPFYINIDDYNRLFLFPTLFKRVSTKN